MPEQEQKNPLGPYGTPVEGPKEPPRRDSKGPRVGRKDILDALKAGAHVAIGPDVYRRGLGGRVTPPLPPPPATPDQPDEFADVVLVRDEHGRLTQEGAEHAIRHGGAVLLGEEAHTSTETLPDLEEYHARVAKGAMQALDQQIAALTAQKTNLQEPAQARGAPGESKLRLGGGGGEGPGVSLPDTPEQRQAEGVPVLEQAARAQQDAARAQQQQQQAQREQAAGQEAQQEAQRRQQEAERVQQAEQQAAQRRQQRRDQAK